MTLKTFLLGMLASFGLAWLCLIAVPTAQMAELPPVKMSEEEEDSPYYERKIAARISRGAEIYGANGCYYCHTQLIRPTYLGRQIWREDVAGVVVRDDKGGVESDTRRETSYYDFDGEPFARIGRSRVGPDLSNFGYRAEKYAAAVEMTTEEWVLERLYNPRNSDLFVGDQGQKSDRGWSSCPSQKGMFEKVAATGQHEGLIVASASCDGKQVVPKEQARLLAGYLLSMKRDDEMPKALQHPVRGGKKETASSEAQK